MLTGDQIQFDHPHDQYTGQVELMEALGITNGDFLAGLLQQVANINGRSKANADEINFALAVIASLEPRDQVETMLGLQMAAAHMATMTFARRLARVQNIQEQDREITILTE